MKMEEESDDVQIIEVIEIFDVDVKTEEKIEEEEEVQIIEKPKFKFQKTPQPQYQKPRPQPPVNKNVVFQDQISKIPKRVEEKLHHRDIRNKTRYTEEETVPKEEGNRTPERARGKPVEEADLRRELQKVAQEQNVKISESNSKKALIEYYEKRLLGNSNYKNNTNINNNVAKSVNTGSQRKTETAGTQTNADEITKKEEPEAQGKHVSDFVASVITPTNNANTVTVASQTVTNKPNDENKKRSEEEEKQHRTEEKVEEEDGGGMVALEETIRDRVESDSERERAGRLCEPIEEEIDNAGGDKKEGRLEMLIRMLSDSRPLGESRVEEEIVQKVEENHNQAEQVEEQMIESENMRLNSQNIVVNTQQTFGTQSSQVEMIYSQSLLTEPPQSQPLAVADNIEEARVSETKVSTSQILIDQEEEEVQPKVSISQMEVEEESANKNKNNEYSPILKGINQTPSPSPSPRPKVSESQIDIKVSNSYVIEDDEIKSPQSITPHHSNNIILQQSQEQEYTVFTRIVPLANPPDDESEALRKAMTMNDNLVSPKFGGAFSQEAEKTSKLIISEMEILKKNLTNIVEDQNKENEKPNQEDVVTKTEEEEEEKCKEEEPSQNTQQRGEIKIVKQKIREAVGEYFDLINGREVHREERISEKITDEGSPKDGVIIVEKEKKVVTEDSYVKEEEEGSGKFSVSRYFN